MSTAKHCTCLRNLSAGPRHASWCALHVGPLLERDPASEACRGRAAGEDLAAQGEMMRPQMQSAGFEFAPTRTGRARWIHASLGLQCLRQPAATDAQWRGALRGALHRAAARAAVAELGQPSDE